ncbi:uncharacterized protein Z518_08607 [Rhinocladiella mackenziei CBS 650.93]|uniref:Zn(2)-C6 fungal-type domain-containing protein n=1 Tax=Rhinocladiella mackenziei CBS 650.93 TaxID=1442369 RepID=A0A0D2J1A6_9EURO|nr:uncharacterized protein Z518_08607 [Rhinocladiella mackenziei CBS 650.93]KIX02665.1 hypothetical protein Z518_08607 [Rhinocladiella mackenziei CBS 650.93]
MSLRLSSLDPNQPRAAKDCRTCNRRRIKCDRSLPTCKKCALKELKCPGYGLRIQWGQGVASRGKLTGRALPVLEPAPSPIPNSTGPNQERASPRSLTPAESSDSREQGFDSVQRAEPDRPTTVPHTLRNAFHPVYDESAFRNPFALNLDLSAYHLPEYLHGKSVQKLIHYFDNVVARIMPWVDGPENAWRTLMLPLAMESPSLLLAILALSAEHYSSKMGSTWSTDDGLCSSHYRDKSLLLLAQNLRTEITEDASVARRGAASAMLATILILCNLEMIRCDSIIWRVHWKAARTITRRWTSHHHSSHVLDDTCRFLVKEAFVYDVFGSSTTFDSDGEILCSALSDKDAHVFTDWLQLVQEVTRAERSRHDNLSADEYSQSLADMRVLQDRFDYARNRSLHFSRTMDFGSKELYSDFTVLIDIFHYAGLVYGYQALVDPQECAAAKPACVSAVISSIGQVENSNAFQHDFVWPLFIVGTESRHNRETQAFAETKLLQAMSSTGFSNCYPALEFLRRFWATDPTHVADWMQFARQESRQGLNFLVI